MSWVHRFGRDLHAIRRTGVACFLVMGATQQVPAHQMKRCVGLLPILSQHGAVHVKMATQARTVRITTQELTCVCSHAQLLVVQARTITTLVFNPIST